jgi:hypothetical protein
MDILELMKQKAKKEHKKGLFEKICELLPIVDPKHVFYEDPKRFSIRDLEIEELEIEEDKNIHPKYNLQMLQYKMN